MPNPVPAIAGVISDLDGVLYRGEAPIADAVEAFRRWDEAGVPYCFVTNNATRTPEDFAAKLTRLGVRTAPAQVVTSPVATADYLRSRWPAGTPVFVLGAAALADAMTQAGFKVTDDGPEVVVVGLDRALTYARLTAAVHAVLAGAALVGTNADPRLPVEGGGFDPGAGSILAAVATATGATPVVVGKPEPRMVEMALERIGTARDATIMIGDQVSTDILAGQRAGLRSVLVTTGVPRDDAATPDRVVDSLLELLPSGSDRPAGPA